ncbi:MAG: RICIN domain-containing protein [Clostridia bacterium]|nr:RICIN domain-containing protein [Clostridia bacterium]
MYQLNGLSAVLAGNGSVALLDKTTGELVGHIPAPYMYDAEGQTSNEVAYTLTDLGGDNYRLTVTADTEWINAEDRAFPVVIDPTVTFDAGSQDTYISSLYPDSNFGSDTKLWVSSYEITFMEYGSLPAIPDNATINYATLNMYYYYYISTGSLQVGLYLVAFDWTENGLTWNVADSNLLMGIEPSLISTSTLAASASIAEATPGLASMNVTELVQAWYAGFPYWGIALKRESGTNESVIIKSREAGTATKAYYEISYTLDTLPVANGTYYLTNSEYENYLQIDNGAAVTDNGAILELWEFDGASDQKWNVEYLHNGTYKITSIASGKVIDAPLNIDEALTQTTYSVSYDQFWIITSVGNGMYKLSPQSNPSYYMAAGSALIDMNGRNAELRTVQSDGKDEWLVYSIDGIKGYTLMYIGLEEGDPMMPPLLNEVESNLQLNAGITGVASTSMSRGELLGNLATSRIFSCVTHGSKTSISTSSTDLTKATIDSLDASAFNNLVLVCLGSCYTGQGGSSAANLANAFYNKGVDAVVSFTGIVVNVQAFAWTKGFMAALASGSTIAEAIDAGDDAENSDYGCSMLESETTTEEHRYFVGNGSIRPCE